MNNKFVSTAQQLRNEASASILLRQITKRFGEPNANVVERVQQATRTELTRWLDRILDAASVAELFAE